jgi:mono/diheme cytochrome c family protein
MKALALILFAACGVAFAGAAEGKNVFNAKCQGCHGPNGEGKPAIAKMFNVTMRPFGSKEVQARSDDEFKKIIATGNGKMKPVSGVSDEQATDIIAYIRTLKQ